MVYIYKKNCWGVGGPVQQYVEGSIKVPTYDAVLHKYNYLYTKIV